MRKLHRLLVIPSLAALVAGSVAPAFADLSTPAVYEIEAKEQYCADATTKCVPVNGRPDLGNLRFAMLEAYRMNGSSKNIEHITLGSNALPDVVLAKCAGPHSIDSRGNIHSPTMFAFIGSSSEGLNGGTISGTVSLRNAATTNTASSAVLALDIADQITGDHGTVTGVQMADNTRNAWVSGGFTITLTGPQYDEIVAGPDANESAPPKPSGANGTMSCTTGSPAVSTPGAPPPYFEDEVFGPNDPNS